MENNIIDSYILLYNSCFDIIFYKTHTENVLLPLWTASVTFVTRSGKRYILGEKFKIAYGVPRESALCQEYDDAINVILARSCD